MVLGFLLESEEDLNKVSEKILSLSSIYGFPLSVGINVVKNVKHKSDGDWEVIA